MEQLLTLNIYFINQEKELMKNIVKLFALFVAVTFISGCTKQQQDATLTIIDQDQVQEEPSQEVKSLDDSDAKAEAVTLSSYIEYSPEVFAAATANDSTAILFFHAAWCSTCQAAEKDITSNLDQIPDGTHILKVDYDTSQALKRKYSVVTQHTFVQVDANGQEVSKWVGGSLDEILERAQ